MRRNVAVEVLLLLQMSKAGSAEAVVMVVVFLQMPEALLGIDVGRTEQIGGIEGDAIATVACGAFMRA